MKQHSSPDGGTVSSSQQGSLLDALGIIILPCDGTGDTTTVQAEMPADERTCQPYGFLSGGASLALEESLAGYGSARLLPATQKPVGSCISAQHVAPVAYGGRVKATASLLHQGRTTHLWNVDVCDDQGRLISTARILNHILPIK